MRDIGSGGLSRKYQRDRRKAFQKKAEKDLKILPIKKQNPFIQCNYFLHL